MDVDTGNRGALERLNVLVGEWSEAADFDDAPPGTTTIEWILDGQFLLERSTIPHPDFPDSLAIISVNSDGETYTKHYFDSRGVARIYKMTLGDGRWTQVRDAPDFSPLAFAQRFVGTISEDGTTITGKWESADDGTAWKTDFELTYHKLPSERTAVEPDRTPP